MEIIILPVAGWVGASLLSLAALGGIGLTGLALWIYWKDLRPRDEDADNGGLDGIAQDLTTAKKKLPELDREGPEPKKDEKEGQGGGGLPPTEGRIVEEEGEGKTQGSGPRVYPGDDE